MSVRISLAAAAAALSLAALPSQALADEATAPLSPESEADLQCVVVFAVVAGASGEEGLAAATAGMVYYLGRLQGREPSVDWVSRIGPYANEFQQSQLADHAERCGSEIGALGQQMMRVGGVAVGSST